MSTETPIELRSIADSEQEQPGPSKNETIRPFDITVMTTEERRDSPKNESVVLNVGGTRYQTCLSTLMSVPNSRLAKMAVELQSEISQGKELYFDRSSSIFNSVLDLYRTGELHVLQDLCYAVLQKELDFWEIDFSLIQPCCSEIYQSAIEKRQMLSELQNNMATSDDNQPRKSHKWRRIIYRVVYIVFLVLTVGTFCVETLPQVRPNPTLNISCTDSIPDKTMFFAITIIDIICVLYFLFDFTFRLIKSAEKRRFIRRKSNIIDIILLGALVAKIVIAFQNPDNICEGLASDILSAFALLRVIRLLTLTQHYRPMKLLSYVLRSSVYELFMIVFILLIMTVIFASLIYYAEGHLDTFTTIPIGFWWAFITMTTVGYGDKAPSTPVGYVVGAACAWCGVIFMALTLPIVSNKFSLFYEGGIKKPPSKKAVDPENTEDVVEDWI